TEVSHTFTPSSPAAATRLPSGLKVTPYTAPACPDSLTCSRPVTASHRRTLPSCPPEATVPPYGLTATAQTPPLCPRSAGRSLPVAPSQTRTSPSGSSQPRTATRRLTPSGANFRKEG